AGGGVASCTSSAASLHILCLQRDSLLAVHILCLQRDSLLAVHRNLLNQPDQARKVGRNQKAPRGSESSQE
ncbi:MAG: hypothetical protein ACPIOQ_25585, partial [Promethearchaeia archaeon]